MRVIKQGDKVIQRASSSVWVITFIQNLRTDKSIDMHSTRSTRTMTMLLSEMTEYRYCDTKEFVLPRVRSNGWTDYERSYMCKHYKTQGVIRVANKINRSETAVVSEMSRMNKKGLVEKYANM